MKARSARPPIRGAPLHVDDKAREMLEQLRPTRVRGRRPHVQISRYTRLAENVREVLKTA